MQDSKHETPSFVSKTRAIVEATHDLKAEQVVALDMREVSSFADSFVIASGRSGRHVRSIADAIIETLVKMGERPLGVEGLEEGHWILIDANDAIISVFEPEAREEFALERLWSDAPVIEFDFEEPAES